MFNTKKKSRWSIDELKNEAVVIADAFFNENPGAPVSLYITQRDRVVPDGPVVPEVQVGETQGVVMLAPELGAMDMMNGKMCDCMFALHEVVRGGHEMLRESGLSTYGLLCCFEVVAKLEVDGVPKVKRVLQIMLEHDDGFWSGAAYVSETTPRVGPIAWVQQEGRKGLLDLRADLSAMN